MSTEAAGIPEVGPAVQIRNRLATVRAVEPCDLEMQMLVLAALSPRALYYWAKSYAEQLSAETRRYGRPASSVRDRADAVGLGAHRVGPDGIRLRGGAFRTVLADECFPSHDRGFPRTLAVNCVQPIAFLVPECITAYAVVG